MVDYLTLYMAVSARFPSMPFGIDGRQWKSAMTAIINPSNSPEFSIREIHKETFSTLHQVDQRRYCRNFVLPGGFHGNPSLFLEGQVQPRGLLVSGQRDDPLDIEITIRPFKGLKTGEIGNIGTDIRLIVTSCLRPL